MFDAYYVTAPDGSVVFDTNRAWPARASLVGSLYPRARIICCVRDVGWIVDSLERMLRKNPLQLSRMFNYQPGATIYSRVEALMNSETGLIGLAWSSLREAWFSEEAKRLIIIDYDRLVSNPDELLRRLYRELGEEWYPHDFNHVDYDEPDYDALLGMPGLHRVRQKVTARSGGKARSPPDIFAKYAGLSYWTKPELNPNGALIL